MGKKILIFCAGVVTGIVLMILMALIVYKGNTPDIGITMFETEGDCVSSNSFEVIQVLDSGNAIAREFKDDDMSIATGVIVLFLSDKNKSYYDDQVINVPSGKCAKQIGIFKYSSKDGFERTIPIVEIRDK